MRFRSVLYPLLMASLCATETFAYPQNPALYSVDNQGDSLTLRNVGDEHYSNTQTSDGYIVLQDSAGVYYYADENGSCSKVKAKNEKDRTAQDISFLKSLDREKVFSGHVKKNPDRFKRPAGEVVKPASWANLNQLEDDSAPAVLRFPSPSKHANGTNRFPVLLVSNSQTTNIDSASFHDLLNKEKYSAEAYSGSVRDYFTEQSGGKFVPTFDIYQVTVSNSFASYKDVEYKLIVEALNSLLSKYPNFNASLYDADNNGEIDALAVLYAGSESAAGNMGGFQYELQWNPCRQQNVGNGKRANRYFIINQQSSPFVVFIHEFSHTMGLKDHYCVRASDCYSDFTNTGYQAPGAHGWDVMATGMYNEVKNKGGGTYNPRRYNPPNYSAFEKVFMGWASYDSLDLQRDVISLPSWSSSNKAYKISIPNRPDEWFIIENRQQDNKWDATLPYHGMLIWHIDYNYTVWENDAMNDDKTHQRIDVVEAGNQLVTSYSDGFRAEHLRDDPFPGTQKVTSFDGFKSWAGTDLGIKLYGIMEDGYNVCFTTKSGVKVSSCAAKQDVASSSSEVVAESSSSSTVKSSSSKTAPSSSSEAMAKSSSSLVTSALHAVSLAQTVEMSMNGSVLEILSRAPGIKRVDIFDLQGNMIFRSIFDGGEFSMNLDRLLHLGVIVVRVSEGSRILGVKKVTSGN